MPTTTTQRVGAIPPPGSTRPWSGRAVTAARAWLDARTLWPATCPLP